jgi:hypothetical protein
MGVNEFDIRNPESRYLTRGWHFANAGFLEISHLWEINPKFLKIMIVGVLHFYFFLNHRDAFLFEPNTTPRIKLYGVLQC